MNVVDKEIVSFKGTRQGILMSIIEDEPLAKALDVLTDKITHNHQFFMGSPISLDLGWRELDEDDLEEILSIFDKNHLRLLGLISSSQNTKRIAENKGLKVIIGRLGLADHAARRKYEKRHGSSTSVIERKRDSSRTTVVEEKNRKTQELPSPTDDTIMIRKTVRSGQTVEHHGNLVIYGDVNAGSEVKAGGDIIIIGTLRGNAHAGRKPGRVTSSIVALKFQPTQISINEQLVNKFDKKFLTSKQPIIATLKDGKIQIEIYG